MTKPDLYQRVVLTRDFPTDHLKRGDVAWLVDYVAHPGDGEEGAILEIFNAVGDSISVVTVAASAIEPMRAEYMPSVRLLDDVTA